jgi:hypothetical protein
VAAAELKEKDRQKRFEKIFFKLETRAGIC